MEWAASEGSCQIAIEVVTECLRRAELQADQIVRESHRQMERWLNRAVHIHEVRVQEAAPSYGTFRTRRRSNDERRRIVDKQSGSEGNQDMDALRREEVALEERQRTLLAEETSETAVVHEVPTEKQRRESCEGVLEGLRRQLQEKEVQCSHLQAQLDRKDEEISAARLESLERENELGRLRRELEDTQRALREQQSICQTVECDGETTPLGLESGGGRVQEQCTDEEDHNSIERSPAADCEWEAETEGQPDSAEARCASDDRCLVPTRRSRRAPAALPAIAVEPATVVVEHADPSLRLEGERSAGLVHRHSEWSHAESPDSSADDTAVKHVERFAAGLSQSRDSYEYLELDDSYEYTEEDVLKYDRIRFHMEQTHPRGRRRGFPDAFGGVHMHYQDIKQHHLEPLFDGLAGDFPGKQSQMEVGAVVREACVVGTKQLRSYWIRRCRELFIMLGADGDFSTYDDHVFNAWVCMVQERCYSKLIEPDSEMRSEFVSTMLKRVSERRGAWPMDVVLQLMNKLWSVVCYAECTAPTCALEVCEAGEMYDAEDYDVFSDNLYYYDDPDELECFGLLPRLVRTSDGETELRGVANILPEQ